MKMKEFDPSECEDTDELNRVGYERLVALDLRGALAAFSRANELAPGIPAATNAIYARTQITDQILSQAD